MPMGWPYEILHLTVPKNQSGTKTNQTSWLLFCLFKRCLRLCTLWLTCTSLLPLCIKSWNFDFQLKEVFSKITIIVVSHDLGATLQGSSTIHCRPFSKVSHHTVYYSQCYAQSKEFDVLEACWASFLVAGTVLCFDFNRVVGGVRWKTQF